MLHHVVADVRATPGDALDESLGHARHVIEALRHHQRADAPLRRRLDHARVSRDERGCDLGDGEVHRVVERRDAQDDSEWYFVRHAQFIAVGSRERVARDHVAFRQRSRSFLRGVIDEVRAALRLGGCVFPRLGDLFDERVGDGGVVRAHELGGGVEDGRAPVQRDLAPLPLSGFRASVRGVHLILGARLEPEASRVALARIGVVHDRAGGGVAPLAVDEEAVGAGVGVEERGVEVPAAGLERRAAFATGAHHAWCGAVRCGDASEGGNRRRATAQKPYKNPKGMEIFIRLIRFWVPSGSPAG